LMQSPVCRDSSENLYESSFGQLVLINHVAGTISVGGVFHQYPSYPFVSPDRTSRTNSRLHSYFGSSQR
jgi:hypothetical protein